jgi:xanthine dehydrogenase molybdenum-binding subunit
MAYDLIGKNFTPPDVRAKVTGSAKYSEDFRADGMLFCKLLTSPMPHARVVSVDASEALAMPGVEGILRASEVPAVAAPNDPILTDEPVYVGEPILAVAAVDEATAAEALEKIRVEYEPLPFTVDPLESLYPGGANARTDGNVAGFGQISDVKWNAQDFLSAGEGRLPMGRATQEWSYGDIEAAFDEADLVLDESFVTQGNAHHSMEPRSCMAYWQNGKCFLHASSQSGTFPIDDVSRFVGIDPADLVFIAEFCGGGFGSKGGGYPIVAVPALLSKKLNNRPVMMRISRHEEYYIGSARHGFQGRIRMGFRADGKLTGVDLFIVQENGPNAGFSDYTSAADAVSIVYTPASMRFRGIPVMTNTPPRGPQRGPGQNQIATAVEPLLDKAARELGIDKLEIRRINAPDSSWQYGPRQSELTSAHLTEALDIGAEQFNYAERAARSGTRDGSKVRAVGIGQAYHSAGFRDADGLVVLTPDGKLNIHSGVGNLGTYSHTATARVAAEVLKCDWENCTVVRGDTSRHLPWNWGQFGSNTSFTMTRSTYAAAMDAAHKLREIAAMTLGGSVEEYELGDERVYRREAPDQHLTYAEAAERAIELGGRFDGHETDEGLNPVTQRAAAGVAGSGLVGVAKDNLGGTATVPTLAAGFIEIELDVETGKYQILDYMGVSDCGTVLHPMGLDTQIKGGAVMGIGLACLEHHVYDPQNGLPANIGLLGAKPPSYLDVPSNMQTAAVGIEDPDNPIGAKGMGEPVMGCAGAALLCAISEALGGHVFNRVPVTPDMIVNAATGQDQSHTPLQVNTA